MERHDDHFGPTTRDEIWLPDVAARGWIAISHNKQIRRVALQRDAAMRGGLALFMLVGKKHDEFQRNLIVTMPRIVAFRKQNQPPFIAHVTRPEPKYPLGSRPGKVQVVLTLAQWKAMLAAPRHKP